MPSAPFRALAPALVLVLPLLSPAPGVPVLASGETVERELAGGEVHAFHLEAQAGQHLLVTVEQEGIDVVLRYQDPSGKALGTVNTLQVRGGEEILLISGEVAGSYRVEIGPSVPGAPKGRYRIQVEELPSSTPEERRRIEAERLMTEAGVLLSQETKEARQKALALYTEALAHWQGLERRREEARALADLALVHQALGESQPMLDRLQEALPLFVSLGDRAGEGYIHLYIGLARLGLSQTREAIGSFERSLEIYHARGNRWGEAMATQNLCLLRLGLGESREAVPCYERVLVLMAEVGEPDAEALNGLGGAYSHLGEPRKAREYYTRSLEKRRVLGDRLGEAKTLNNLGVLSANQDALGEALAYYGEALEMIRKAGDRSWEARILTNLGNAYLLLGEPRRALAFFEEALPIRRGLKERSGEVNTLCNLGLAHELLGDHGKALGAYEEALVIARGVEYRTGEASSLNLLAGGHFATGNPDQALDLFTQAATLHRELGSRGGLSFSLQRIGEIENRRGQREKALATLREALDLRRLLGDPAGQAETLASIAMVERGLGRLNEALTHAEEAIRILESVRATVGDPNLRASFLASRRASFDIAIALRMELDRRQPGKGHAEAAFSLSERARARSLLDLLHEARMEIRQEMSPDLRERDSTLAYRFSNNAVKLRGAKSDEQRAALRHELAELLAEADLLEDEIRRANPRYAVLDQPPLDAAGVRKLLDPDTLLLEYTLGEERSFLWAVSSARVEGFELPGRSAIEAAARSSYAEIRKAGGAGQEAHRTLSRILLGPVADRLHCQRLVIVADGALQYVPFAVLPDPGDPTGGTPLLVGHEIVSLPSASVLEVQRRVLAGRPRPEKAVAIFADPVFVPWDNRLPRRGVSPAANRPAASQESIDMPRIQRLAASGREAQVIKELLPPDQVFVATGLQASRGTALSGILSKYRIVHFATHGWIDSETPRSSGLTLSMVDEKGQPQEGLLSLSDIYNLDLGADLVVLSGCETALGREIRGEGLMGLTQGFLYAGAERVMASLWRVEDRATAELMRHFYLARVKQGLSPAAALRSAQLAIRKDPRWADPFYWAPFVLQGDWR